MKLSHLFIISFIFISCSNDYNGNEANDPALIASDFSPNTQGDYWEYNANSNSADLPEMNFSSVDSFPLSSFEQLMKMNNIINRCDSFIFVVFKFLTM